MGDNDDSSNAAHRAHEMTETQPGRGLFSRLRNWMGGTAEVTDTVPAPEISRSMSPIDGMMNLRRMRVEDVAVPRADIVSVADTITKSELVDVKQATLAEYGAVSQQVVQRELLCFIGLLPNCSGILSRIL